MKYRKKPIIIEATQWLKAGDHPAVMSNRECCATDDGGLIQTLECNMHVTPGDWIITGVKGEVYPCKPDIFEKTYEAVIE